MFLRSTNRKKDSKDHRYFNVVENRHFTFKARCTLRIVHEGFWQEFDCDTPAELGVRCLVNVTYSPGTKVSRDGEVVKLCSDHELGG